MAKSCRCRLPPKYARMQDVGMPTRPSWLRILPWLVAFVGLASPLIAGSGAGWPYVVGWLVVLGLLAWVMPLDGADRRHRIQLALIVILLLVVPGFAVGGFYLLPAALVWLALAAKPADNA